MVAVADGFGGGHIQAGVRPARPERIARFLFSKAEGPAMWLWRSLGACCCALVLVMGAPGVSVWAQALDEEESGAREELGAAGEGVKRGVEDGSSAIGERAGAADAEQKGAAAPVAAPAIDRADNAWLLISSALVLMMTAPGLAMFYGGLVRKKNVLGVMMQCVFLMGLNSVIWGIYGYSLAFGGDASSAEFSRWIGNGEYLLMHNAQPHGVGSARQWPIAPGTSVPTLTHMLFQGMFFIITPALICGAFAERMKFSTMVVFMIVWGTLVYCPLCHWVWDGGILAYGSEHALFGALDFAGGTVVHIS